MKKKRVVSIEDRIPKLKQMRKKKANRRLIFYLSVFFVLISIVIYLQSPLSNIHHIHVTGNKRVSEADVISQSTLSTETNIWTFKGQDIEERLNALPLIDSVNVHKKLPRTVNINITEHKVIGYLEKENKFQPVIGNGTVLSTQKNNGDAPIMINFSDEKQLINMTNELEQLPDSILNLISEIHWQPTKKNNNKIVLYMKDGYIVDGTIRNFGEKIQVYPSIVSQLDSEEQGIIHIGVGAYFEKIEKNSEDID